MRNPLKDTTGSVFVTTMLSMLMMVMVGGHLYQMSSYDMTIVQSMKRSAQAQALAEAGLARALATLQSDWSTRNNAANFPVTALGQGSYDASVSQVSGRWLVSSVGTVDGKTRTVTAEVSGPALSALDYGLAAGASISFNLVGQSDVEVDGKVYGATGMTLTAQAGSSSIEITSPGNLDANGTITVSGSGTINTGAQDAAAGTAVFPTFDFAYYQAQAQANGYYFNGNRTYSTANSLPAAANGIIFINGNVTISNTQTTTSCIVATGNITISGGQVTINNPDTLPALVTQNGYITISGTGNSNPARLNANGLIYSGNNFSITGNHHNVDIDDGLILAKGSILGNYSGGAHNDLEVEYAYPGNVIGLGIGGASAVSIESYNS